MSNSFTLEELWKEELFPVGQFETIPVTVTKNIPFEEYPSVVAVSEIQNCNILYDEYLKFKKELRVSPSRYIKERLKFLKLPINEWNKLFTSYGFNDKQYETYSMRILGTNILRTEIGNYTRQTLESFNIPLFRQQYAVANPKWRTKIHIDTNRLDLHGFRIMIPLNTTFNIGFEEGIYSLTPGKSYFVNVSKPHYGLNPEEVARCNIMIHLSSDSIIDFDNKIVL